MVLQPHHYDAAQLADLTDSGCELLAYVSLGEDSGPAQPWQRPEVNPLWGVHYVNVADAAWHEHVLGQVAEALDKGFTGLLLDTLDTPDLFPEFAAPLVTLVDSVRELTPGYIIANRGFRLMRELTPLVDAFLFEGFSTTWIDGYKALCREQLAAHSKIAYDLQTTKRELFALDYADTPALAEFARNRAVTHGMTTQVSDRLLTTL